MYDRFYLTEGPGMMGRLRTFFMANAWERWYNGWVELVTGATHANSDVQGPASLTTTNGEFTLRDYVASGDVIRIRLPNSSQYLWLENHQRRSPFDDRYGYEVGSQTPSNPLRGAPTGIIAMVEDVAASRTDLLDAWNTGCNGLRVVSAQGNFDYTRSANPNTFNNYFLNYLLYDFTNPVANPFGGESQITRRRTDLNNDGTIYNDVTAGNTGTVSEATPSFILNGQGEDGIFGPDAAFNVGQKMGNSYNPAIFEQQRYDLATAKLAPIKLGGLSVELLRRNKYSGEITIKVRYDDVTVAQNTRWSGELQMTDVAGAANGADVLVGSGKTLTINKSGTNNRHTKLAGEFINPTTFTCGGSNVLFLQGSGSTVSVEGAKTAFQVKDGGELKLNPYGTTFAVKTGAVLDIQSGGTYTGWYATTTRIEAGGSLVVRSGGKLQGNGGLVQVQAGAYLCIEAGADLTSAGLTLDVAPGAIIGTNPALGLGPLNCDSQLQFCGRLTGGNTALSTICPTGNEALLFDGQDDRVTIPQDPNGSFSPIHNLDQTFTIEALITPVQVGLASKPIFSTRLRDATGFFHGLMFTVYDNNNLLLQINEQNYFDLNDPSMKLTSGCHHVAVSRDNANQLHFYIDGRRATYSPTYVGDPHTTGSAFIGGDSGYYSDESFEGTIGEVRVWNTTRSDAEINQYKAATLTTPQAGLVGYYDMRDPSAQNVGDISGIYATSYYTPDGYLGTTPAPDSNDPSWVLAANLTCNVNGNYRLFSTRKIQPDTTGRAGRPPFRNVQPSTTGKHLSQLTLAPNPASGEAILHFQLRDAGKLEVCLQDAMGQTRATALPATTLAAGAHDVRLPLQKLPPGLYLVVVNSADGREVIRLDVK